MNISRLKNACYEFPKQHIGKPIMNLNIQGKQINIGDSLREHINSKVEELNAKFFNRTITGSVTLSPDGGSSIRAHIKLGIGREIDVESQATQHDAYKAFDDAAEKVEKQMRRYKRRLRDHRQRVEDTPESEALKARNYVISLNEETEEANENAAPESDEPLIIAEMSTNVQKLSVSEAVMHMDLSGQPALLFRNLTNDSISMVYRREDGNIGWVDTEQTAKKPKGGETLAAE
tara:strand:- start:143673 stop:144371 length:699 start_codon:yes stop_codon:yes gene_type:complete